MKGQWGIFSQTIPGRVGYQCSNYYRKLVKNGKLESSEYYVGEDGKLHYRFQGKKGSVVQDSKEEAKRSRQKESSLSCSTTNSQPRPPKPAKKKRKKYCLMAVEVPLPCTLLKSGRKTKAKFVTEMIRVGFSRRILEFAVNCVIGALRNIRGRNGSAKRSC